MPETLQFYPATPDRWKDLEALFGPKGACAGCWCMFWRLSRPQFTKGQGESNRRALKTIVNSGEVPGIIAYDGEQPIGWCSISPRENFASLERSRTLARIDDKPTWSIVCFFVDRTHRRQRVMEKLLKAAVKYAKANGAKVVEGYPVTPTSSTRLPAWDSFRGVTSVFVKAGFEEVARRSANRPVMRYYVKK
jgi:GNAT superfamily N-acetyltransferase